MTGTEANFEPSDTYECPVCEFTSYVGGGATIVRVEHPCGVVAPIRTAITVLAEKPVVRRRWWQR